MRKTLSEERRQLREEAEALEKEIREADEEGASEYLVRVANVAAELDQVEEHFGEMRSKLDRIRRSVARDRPAFEALTVEMPKWRTTILLGLNSAAIAALVSNEQLSASVRHSGGVLFLLGAVFAFFSGAALDHVGRSGLALLDELDGITLEYVDDPSQDRAATASKRHLRFSGIAEWLRAASMACFAIGVLTVI